LDVASPVWFAAGADSEGLPYYLAVLRSRVWFIAITTAVCLGAALLYLSQAEKVYQASADLLITPVPPDNASLIGLGLPHESSDPTRDVETIARLIETQVVARRVVRALGLDVSAPELLAKVDATPVASSNIVTVSAKANSPDLAARIANTFAEASVAQRTAQMHAQLDVVIPQLKRQVAGLGPNDDVAREGLVASLRDLETLRALKDPTIRLETPAEPPSAQIAPRPALSVAAALVAGLIIGGAAVLALEFIDPRLRREEQLRRFRIPILTRVPFEGRSSRRRSTPLLPAQLSPAAHDSYLLLGATLSADSSDGRTLRSVLVTGSDPGVGKTTSALNLAVDLSATESVVLVEGDTRRPSLGRALNVNGARGLTDVLLNRCQLNEAVVDLARPGLTSAPQASGLQLLGRGSGETSLSRIVTSASAASLIRQAHQVANWLVVDTPPLALAPDTLPLAKQVDYVLVVVRLGSTRLRALEELAELLVQQGVTPAGFVLIRSRNSKPYYAAI
jgi:Mrp family chromosome partitioning ATPase